MRSIAALIAEFEVVQGVLFEAWVGWFSVLFVN
jgi:hypothetical protein